MYEALEARRLFSAIPWSSVIPDVSIATGSSAPTSSATPDGATLNGEHAADESSTGDAPAFLPEALALSGSAAPSAGVTPISTSPILYDQSSGVVTLIGRFSQKNTLSATVSGSNIVFVANSTTRAIPIAAVSHIYAFTGDFGDLVNIDWRIKTPVTMQGGTGNDTLLGGDGVDTIYGGGGHDLIDGRSGNDILSGGWGNDTVLGFAGNDTIYGGDGNDLVDGGAGTNLITDTAGTNTIRSASGVAPAEKPPGIASFVIFDADADMPLMVVAGRGAGPDPVIDLAAMPTRNLALVAMAFGNLDRVRFDFDGKYTYRNDFSGPRTLGGDTSGDLAAFEPLGRPGSHTVFSKAYAPGGIAGGYIETTLRVIDSSAGDTPPETDPQPEVDPPQITGFALYDLSAGVIMQTVTAGSTINRALLTGSVALVALADSGAGSVRLGLGGQWTTDNAAPFALAALPGVGSHTVSAIAYSAVNAAGVAGNTATVSFTVIDTAAVITAKNTTVIAGQAVHVHGLASSLTAGNALGASYAWDFGDPSGRFNQLEGFNAAHVYDTPGNYTITLTVTDTSGTVLTARQTITVEADTRRTIYVSASGTDTASGLSPSTPIRSWKRATELLAQYGSNTSVLFRRGDRFDIDTTSLVLRWQNTRLGAYGSGDHPVIYRSDPLLWEIITVDGAAANVTIEDLAFDSFNGHDAEKAGGARAIRAAGANLLVRNNLFINVSDAVNAEAQPSGLLVLDNVAPAVTSIRAYFVWSQGSDVVVLGNVAPNSTREHILRVGGTDRLLVAHNAFANVDRTSQGDSADIAKGTYVLQKGSYFYVTDNTGSTGGLGVGPLGGGDGSRDASARAKWVVVKNNDFNDTGISINPGVEHVLITDNVIRRDNAAAISITPVDGFKDAAGNLVYGGRNVYDLTIAHNTVVTLSKNGKFLHLVNEGAADQITLKGNVYYAPLLEAGYNQNAVIYVADSDLSSFATIEGNIWTPPNKSFWVANCAVYIWPSWSDARGYQTASQWLSQAKVDGDVFSKVTITDTQLTATVGGITAGARR